MLTAPDLSTFLIRVFWRGLLGAALASTGFGVLFNVRGKSLAAAGLTGGAGGMVYQFCLMLGQSDPMSNFFAAVVISVISEICARKLKNTVSTFTACALIPLVPGGTAYEMMVEFTQENAMSGLMKMLDVVTIAGMLAMGILLVSTMTRFFFYSRRKLHGTRQTLSRYPLYVSPNALRSSQLKKQLGHKLQKKGHAAGQKRHRKRRKPQKDAAAGRSDFAGGKVHEESKQKTEKAEANNQPALDSSSESENRKSTVNQ